MLCCANLTTGPPKAQIYNQSSQYTLGLRYWASTTNSHSHLFTTLRFSRCGVHHPDVAGQPELVHQPLDLHGLLQQRVARDAGPAALPLETHTPRLPARRLHHHPHLHHHQGQHLLTSTAAAAVVGTETDAVTQQQMERHAWAEAEAETVTDMRPHTHTTHTHTHHA